MCARVPCDRQSAGARVTRSHTTRWRNQMRKVVLAAVVGAGALALSALNVSAAIVCTGPVCWHAHEAYTYPPEPHVTNHASTLIPEPAPTFRQHARCG